MAGGLDKDHDWPVQPTNLSLPILQYNCYYVYFQGMRT